MKEKERSSPLLLKYQRAYDKDPKSRVFAPLAEAYRRLGMIDEAMEILKKGLKNHSGYTMGHLALAGCYMDQKEYALVYSSLRPFLDENRDNLRLQKLFGKSCIELGHYEEALETFKYLLFVNPKDKDIAEQVEFLENLNFDETYSSETEQVSADTSASTFAIGGIKSSPSEFSNESNIDEWIRVDLSSLEQKSTSINSDNGTDWQDSQNSLKTAGVDGFQKDNMMTESINEKNIQKEEVNRIIEPNEEDTPVITHTLVDLYCEQGYIHKAIEILEKILVSNPEDYKTVLKLEEIKKLLLAGKYESNAEKVDKKLYDEGREDLMNHLDRRLNKDRDEKIKKLEAKLNIFLHRIQDRATKYRKSD
ncbi:MAG: hypothetical protein KAQ98_02115 [Bacteriovoracaceae bacterium]|nr:hypothetical protein [Bacteriovoracaceae bacterium]